MNFKFLRVENDSFETGILHFKFECPWNANDYYKTYNSMIDD